MSINYINYTPPLFKWTEILNSLRELSLRWGPLQLVTMFFKVVYGVASTIWESVLQFMSFVILRILCDRKFSHLNRHMDNIILKHDPIRSLNRRLSSRKNFSAYRFRLSSLTRA